MAREMTGDELRAFLAEGTRTAKLGTAMRDGSPHVMPVWFVLEGSELVFNTGADTVKGRNLRRDPRASIVVDDERPPFAFVHLRGEVAISEDPTELLRTATAIARRYVGADRAEEFGRRNGVPGELVCRFAPERTIAIADMAE
ncbi:MAG TPA: PPOX class F420-dependent oxidoreductase [Solirubrobacteraceae bacterium]|jgi:PPOX class probable F420-dependent enzyme|nr:PPOX class F420-dependent oxidoreductase [Solirubrobacteraceae bacterium]